VRVALFVTCLVDTLTPHVGRATVELLERLGVEVVFPRAQTCCGQLHHNAGYARDAALLARRYGQVFEGFDAIVTPSGSCAGHVRRHVPDLAPESAPAAAATLELSELLVDRLGSLDVGSTFTGSVAYHPTCHSLRVLGLGDRPERLLGAVPGLDLRVLGEATECCGFGGAFAVKNAAVSSAMLDEKLGHVLDTGADAVCACDSSCLLHIGGGLERRGSRVRAVHLAEVLAS
jgi:L-lactate dehydrogenase complex protein LldE